MVFGWVFESRLSMPTCESSREGGTLFFRLVYTGGVHKIPMLLRCRFLRAPSIESFKVGFFGKLMDGTVAKKRSFSEFFSQNFFSTSQNEVDFVKIGDFLQSVLCWLYFPAERSKNVTNRK